MGKQSTNMSMIDMDDLVSKISVEMAPWDELKLYTACVCCDCSFWTEYPQCCGCREVGTCMCCSGAGMCNIDWSNVAEGFCCQAVSVAYCINMKTCKADCMGAIGARRLAKQPAASSSTTSTRALATWSPSSQASCAARSESSACASISASQSHATRMSHSRLHAVESTASRKRSSRNSTNTRAHRRRRVAATATTRKRKLRNKRAQQGPDPFLALIYSWWV